MQQYAMAQAFMKFPALTLMVILRRDLGYRLLNPLVLIAVFGVLAVVAILAMPGNEAARPVDLLIFAGLGRGWSFFDRSRLNANRIPVSGVDSARNSYTQYSARSNSPRETPSNSVDYPSVAPSSAFLGRPVVDYSPVLTTNLHAPLLSHKSHHEPVSTPAPYTPPRQPAAGQEGDLSPEEPEQSSQG